MEKSNYHKKIYDSNRRMYGCLISFFLFLALQIPSSVEGISYIPISKVKHPSDNPWSQEKHELGRRLFFDPILSGDNSISCASCHKREFNWTDGLARAKGFKGKELARNSPTILNSGFSSFQFWDGRAPSLEDQAKAPIQSPVEMNQNVDELIYELKSNQEYVALFQKAFGSEKIDLSRIAKAIAVFERSLISGTSPYDRFWRGDKTALSKKAKKGMDLFFGKAKCSICHNGPFFTDNQFHNIGVPASEEIDLGRQKITGEEFHERAFKTPGLRDLSLSGPYMHDGSLKSLKEVIEFYDKGGDDNENKSPFIGPIGLSDREENNLVEFLISLTSDAFPGYPNNDLSPRGITSDGYGVP
jgi:cytochrome c peroxidase